MTTDQELAFTPAWKLRDMMASKQVSPVELTELYLRRIEALDHNLNAYLTVTADEAMQDAKQAEAAIQSGQSLGPLHGIPISIKDLNLTKGVRTTRGSLLFKDFVPQNDEPVVRRIKEAGAIILGKTNTPEFGASATTENRLGEPCRNPWDTKRTSGRFQRRRRRRPCRRLAPPGPGQRRWGINPHSLQSLRYLWNKAHAGLGVSRPYKGPGGWGQFSQNGPMTRTVRDTALLLQVMAGPDPEDAIALQEEPPDFSAKLDKGVAGLRIGWSPDMGSLPVDPEVRRITEEAAHVFEELGATVEEADVPIDHDNLRKIFMIIWLSDYAAVNAEILETRADEYTGQLREMLEEAVTWPAFKLASALHGLEWHRYQMNNIVTQYDLLLTPTLATAAFPVEQRPTVIDGREVGAFWGFTSAHIPHKHERTHRFQRSLRL